MHELFTTLVGYNELAELQVYSVLNIIKADIAEQMKLLKELYRAYSENVPFL